MLGFVNPEAGVKYAKDTSKVKVQQLTKKDVMVLYGGGGSNDIARNNSTVGMKHLLGFVTNANHTSVILMSATHRYNLMSNSCVNNEVEKFNGKLFKRLERFGKVEITDVVCERNLYIKHVQHLNSEGRESMAKMIASTIECLLNKKVKPISGKWYTDEEKDTLDHQPVQEKADKPEEGNNQCSSTSGVLDTSKVQDPEEMYDCENILVVVNKKSPKRPRRQPVTRNKDFLWTDISKN